jgi:hypothetical protein
MTKDEMLAEFDVLGFAYGICVVRRKSDGVRGTLDFADDHAAGRRYFGFVPE